MDASRAQELAERYANLRVEKQKLEQGVKDIQQEMRDIADVIWMFMEDHQTTSIKGQNNIRVTMGTPKVKAWWKKENDAQVRKWLAEHGYEEVARGTIHWATQCSVVKDLLEQKIPVPEEIEYKLEPTIVVTDHR